MRQTVWIQIRSVGPDQGSNYLQRLSADEKVAASMEELDLN